MIDRVKRAVEAYSQRGGHLELVNIFDGVDEDGAFLGENWSDSFFGTSARLQDLWLNYEGTRAREFDLQSRLIATQPIVPRDTLKGVIENIGEKEPPLIGMLESTGYILDGHHRIVAALLEGRVKMDARVVALDSYIDICNEAVLWGGHYQPLTVTYSGPYNRSPSPSAYSTNPRDVKPKALGPISKELEEPSKKSLDRAYKDKIPAGLGFRSAAAEEIWQAVKKLSLRYKTISTAELVRLALDKTGVDITELKPEDVKVLEMGVEWLRNGPDKPIVRLRGGTPGFFGLKR